MAYKVKSFVSFVSSAYLSLWILPLKFLFDINFISFGFLSTLFLDLIDLLNGKCQHCSLSKKQVLFKIETGKKYRFSKNSLEEDNNKNIETKLSAKVASKQFCSSKHLKHELKKTTPLNVLSPQFHEGKQKISNHDPMTYRPGEDLFTLHEETPSSVRYPVEYQVKDQLDNSAIEDPVEGQSYGHNQKELLNSSKFSENFNGVRDNVLSPISTEQEDALSYLSFTSSSMSALIEEYGSKTSRINGSIEDIERNLVKLNKQKERLEKHRNKCNELNKRRNDSQEKQDSQTDDNEIKKASTHSSIITNGLEL